ncbi:MAG: DegT/DnrJ/EryC1/StrS family aminotransferase [Acidimicrobiia bacterium]|nr:DegT/DnrJ/EryC1/StrS family aminotransferase [Acidimicrobiia bacterium]
MTQPAIIGGKPLFPDGVPFVRPPAPPLERVMKRLEPSYNRGMLTNGPLVRELEDAATERLGTRHAVAVSSCTAGLMLVLRALEPAGPVLVAGFTFSATAHAVAWCGRRPLFAECDPRSFQLDVADSADRMRRTGDVGAILATHLFGAPCRVEDIEALAAEVGVPAAFDAAHAFGARRGDRPVGAFGVAEVFSMSPTKPVVAGEGGIVATNDDAVAESVRIGRDYGNPGDYDTLFVGLNARMSEMHAAVALESLADLAETAAARSAIAQRYTERLAGVPGIAVQHIDPGDVSSWKDFTIQVDEEALGVGRDALAAALRAEGVDTRCYFDPPVHLQQSHATGERLPVTEAVAARVVSLPIYPALPLRTVDLIAEAVARVHEHAEAVGATQAARP